MISPAEERALIVRAQAGDIEARNDLVMAHLPLLRLLAGKASGGPWHTDGSLGIAAEAFMRGIAKFDVSRGIKLTSYAARFVPKHVRRDLRNRRGPFHIPTGALDKDSSDACREAALAAMQSESIHDMDGTPDGGQVVDWREEPPDPDRIDPDRLRRALAGLKPRSLKVLRWRMDGETLEQIGVRLGVTRERVRQIEQEAIRLVQRSLGLPA